MKDRLVEVLLIWTMLPLACSAAPEEADALDLAAIPGPWENHVVALPDRVVDPETGEASDLEMHYLAAGPVDGERVVLLHGFPDLAYSWREVIPLLSDDHRVIAPDLRGYGATGKPDGGYDVETLAGDVVALLDASAAADGVDPARPVHLVGHDWGSGVGWWVAIDAPQRLASYTAISVPHPATFAEFVRERPEQRRRSGYMLLLSSRAAPRLFAGYGEKRKARLYRKDLDRAEGFTDEDLAWYVAAFDTVEETRGPLLYYRTMMQSRKEQAAAMEQLDPVAVPVLMVAGKRDPYLMWEMAEATCEHVDPGQCEVALFEDASHFVQWEDPAGLVDRWRAFAAGLTPTTAAAPPPAAP